MEYQKLFFGETGVNNSIVDTNGEYGMTQGAMAIVCGKECNNIKNAIESKKFKDLLDSCNWSNYRIDWRMFNYFKKDFWKEFI